MSSTTSGDLQLTKPAYTDPADIADINANMDAIDTAVSDLNSKTLKPITVSVDSLTNASGSYNHTTSNLTLVTEDMKAIDIEVGTPETFKAPVTVTTGNHTINISCPSVSGSSTVKVTLIHTQPVEGGQNVPSSITSTEFDILAGRIGTLSALQTSVKTDTVSAINSLSEQIGNLITVVVLNIWNNESINAGSQKYKWVSVASACPSGYKPIAITLESANTKCIANINDGASTQPYFNEATVCVHNLDSNNAQSADVKMIITCLKN
jgi:hypothetical protein